MKEKAKEELKAFLLITLYLWLFLGSFATYRRLIAAEGGVPYLHYGIALIEALIVAKIILIGDLFQFSRRFQDKPLIAPVIYRSVLFGGLVLLFGLAEHIVEGWFNGDGLIGGVSGIRQLGADEVAARVLMMMVALVPLVAFSEISRALGPGRLRAMFFGKAEARATG